VELMALKASIKKALLFVNLLARPDSDVATRRHRDAKTQKNFDHSGAVPLAPARLSTSVQKSKRFLVLFFKKEPLLLILLPL
jgi:hypothetical protein